MKFYQGEDMDNDCYCDRTDGLNEEFWGLVNPLMLVLADILDHCSLVRGPRRNSEEYMQGWNDLANTIRDLLDGEGLLTELDKLIG